MPKGAELSQEGSKDDGPLSPDGDLLGWCEQRSAWAGLAFSL